METKSSHLRPIEKLTFNAAIDYDITKDRDEVMQKVAKAHKELTEYF